MKRSIHQTKKINELKRKALLLYEKGLTTREVGKIIGRSHTWVWLVIQEKEGKKLST
jgi:orotate phosphoribosyltransferase-like protein